MRYELLITDIDGTLLNREHELPDVNALAVRLLNERGFAFTLATGRIEAAVSAFVRALNVSIPVILYNGARLVNPSSGQVLFQRHLRPSAVMAALELLRDFSVDVNLYSEGKLFVCCRTEAVREHELKDGVNAHVVGDLLPFVRTRCPGPVTKLLIIGDERSLAQIELAFGSRPQRDATLVRSESTYLEVLPVGVSKGLAMKVLCRHLGVPLEKVVAIGDAPNDLDMLVMAGLGIAVANAHDAVISAADYVAPSCDEGAVAHVIQRFFFSPH